MGEALLTSLAMDDSHLFPFLSMKPTCVGAASMATSHDDGVLGPLIQQRQQMAICRTAPDINLPFFADQSPPPSLNSGSYETLDVGHSPQIYEAEASDQHIPKVCNRKYMKRCDRIWGAWFFFSLYFKPVLSEKSKAKTICNKDGVSGFDKSDLKLDVFLVQHDMENLYMWVFKEKPENALGKMQLRCYMNGHHRPGDPQFPFSSDKGFVRSHRMQRKQYRGLSNPQCIHGVEFVRLPNFAGIVEEDLKKWMELTGRELKFSIPIEAPDFGSWRNTPSPDFVLDRPPSLKCIPHPHPKRMLNGSGFTIPTQSSNHNFLDLSPQCKKRRKEFFPMTKDEECCLPTTSYTDWHQEKEVHDLAEPSWFKEFSSLMRHMHGPVTAAKTIYEDDEGHLIIVSLPFCEQRRVKVCWRNGPTHGIVKISCVSTGRMPYFKRHGRTFKLADPSPEHCAPGEFVREIPLRSRIPEDANLEAYYDESGTVLEIMVPKHSGGPQEHEIHVSMHPPHLETNDLMLNWECSDSSFNTCMPT